MKKTSKKTCVFKQLKERVNQKKLLVFLIFQALIAAMYVALTLPLNNLAFNDLQFRLSEVLLFLILFDKKHIIGITLGTFIANLFSPMPQFDLTLGILATVFACISMGLTSKYYLIAFIFPAVFNALLVPVGLNIISKVPYWSAFLYVGLSEVILMYFITLPLYLIIRKTELKNLLYFNIYKKDFNVEKQ